MEVKKEGKLIIPFTSVFQQAADGLIRNAMSRSRSEGGELTLSSVRRAWPVLAKTEETTKVNQPLLRGLAANARKRIMAEVLIRGEGARETRTSTAPPAPSTATTTVPGTGSPANDVQARHISVYNGLINLMNAAVAPPGSKDRAGRANTLPAVAAPLGASTQDLMAFSKKIHTGDQHASGLPAHKDSQLDQHAWRSASNKGFAMKNKTNIATKSDKSLKKASKVPAVPTAGVAAREVNVIGRVRYLTEKTMGSTEWSRDDPNQVFHWVATHCKSLLHPNKIVPLAKRLWEKRTADTAQALIAECDHVNGVIIAMQYEADATSLMLFGRHAQQSKKKKKKRKKEKCRTQSPSPAQGSRQLETSADAKNRQQKNTQSNLAPNQINLALLQQLQFLQQSGLFSGEQLFSGFPEDNVLARVPGAELADRKRKKKITKTQQQHKKKPSSPISPYNNASTCKNTRRKQQMPSSSSSNNEVSSNTSDSVVKRRRTVDELPEDQCWVCPHGCGRRYRKTSSLSRRRHLAFKCPVLYPDGHAAAVEAARLRARHEVEEPGKSEVASNLPKKSDLAEPETRSEVAEPERSEVVGPESGVGTITEAGKEEEASPPSSPFSPSPSCSSSSSRKRKRSTMISSSCPPCKKSCLRVSNGFFEEEGNAGVGGHLSTACARREEQAVAMALAHGFEERPNT